MAKGRMQGTQAQLRRLRDEELRKGQAALKNARHERMQAQHYARTWEVYTWQARFHADDADRTTKLQAQADQAQRLLGLYWSSVQRYESAAAEHLATARKAGAALAHRERKAAPRQPWDLWVLLTVCWRGWIVQRGKRVLY